MWTISQGPSLEWATLAALYGIMTPSRGPVRASMMREACNNGELVPRSVKGQVRAINPTRCARRKFLAPIGDEQGWQGN